MNEYVWYAGYGSNIDTSRFYYYIKGGILEITGRNHYGSRDRTIPIKQSIYSINHELYFAKTSPSWEDKAVAFLKANPDKSKITVCALYLVTKQQFVDIMVQENGKEPPMQDIFPNMEAAKLGDDSFIGKSNEYTRYGRLLYLGEHENFPIFTFTSKDSDDSIVPAEPGANYLKVIGNGLITNLGMTVKEASFYLFSKSGVTNSSWTFERIKNLF